MTTDVNTIAAAAYTSTATYDQLQNVLTENQATTAAPPDESQDTVISKDEVPPARTGLDFQKKILGPAGL